MVNIHKKFLRDLLPVSLAIFGALELAVVSDSAVAHPLLHSRSVTRIRQPVVPVPTPSATAIPTPTPPQSCSGEFKRAYFNTMHETQNAEIYASQGQKPPNLLEASVACAKMNQTFKGIACTLAGEDTVPRSDDFNASCEKINELYVKAKGAPLSITPLPPEKVNDETPLYQLDLARLELTVKDGAKLQYAVEQGSKVVAILGQLMTYVKSIDVDARTRCMFTHERDVTPTKLADKMVLKISDAVESFSPGFHLIKLMTDDGRLTIYCLSDVDRLHQTADLKAAFGSMLEFKYLK